MMLNGLYALAWAFVFVGGTVAYCIARRLDERDVAEWHLLHGPNDGCVECRDK